MFTAIVGSPEDFERAESYLRNKLKKGTEDLTDDVAGERSKLEGLFEGDAGSTFRSRTGTLVTACDNIATATDLSANQIEALGVWLKNTQHEMLWIRTQAIVAGLDHTSTHVRAPGPGATAAQVELWNDTLVPKHDKAIKDWWGALEDVAQFAESQFGNLLGLANGLIVAGYTQKLLGKLKSDLLTHAQEKAALAANYQQRAADVAQQIADGTLPDNATTRGQYHGLLDHSSSLAREADDYTDVASGPHVKLSPGVTRSLDVLGNLAIGYSIWDDIRNGEPVDQAVVSQGGGALAGFLAGGRSGAIIGSRFHPLFGTIGGVIVGGIVGIFVDAGIDEAYEANDQPERVPLDGSARVERETDINGLLSSHTSTSPRELIMDHDAMKQSQGRLLLAADTLEAKGKHSPHGNYGDASALVELLIGAHEEACAALAAESTMIAVAVAMCSADGQQADAEQAFAQLRMTKDV